MPVACGGVAVVLRLETPEPVPLRASVGSTEASESLPARVGVVGPTRARYDHLFSANQNPWASLGSFGRGKPGVVHPAKVGFPGDLRLHQRSGADPDEEAR